MIASICNRFARNALKSRIIITNQLSTISNSSEAVETNKKKSKDGGGGGGKMNTERKGELDREKKMIENLQGFLDAAEKAKHHKIEFTAEEQAEHNRIGKEYSRQIRIRDNQEKKDYATKIWLQQEAMRAMPAELRAHAEIIDETPPPKGRPWPVWQTPPIKGFDAQKFTVRKGEDGDDDVDEGLLAAASTSKKEESTTITKESN